MQLDTLFRDIATIIAEKCVNPETQRPYTLSLIERALHDIHFSVVAGKSAKAQALRAIAALKQHMPLERAKMKLRLTVPASDMGGDEGVSAWLSSMSAAVEREEKSGSDLITVEVVVDPGHFRGIDEDIKRRTSGRGAVEVLSLSASGEGGEGGAGRAGRGGRKGGKDDDDYDSDEDGDADGGEGVAAVSNRLVATRLGGDSSSAAASTAAATGSGGSASASNDMTAASARGTGMLVRRVVQPGAARTLACTACALTFEDSAAHREHHRTDLHRFNLKRKVKMMEPLTTEQFDALPAKEKKAFLDADL